MATHSTVWTGILSGSTGSLAVGTCVLTDGTNYIPATTANRTTYGRTVGIAITAASTNNAAFEYQVAGLISNSITGLGAGATSWVRASATATLERCTPSGSDDVVGWCEANGDLHVCPGFLTAAIVNGGGGTPGGSTTQVQYNNAGSFGGIAGATTDGTTLTVKDVDFVIADDLDATKKAQFQCSGLTTATTRTFTLPDATTTLVGIDVGQTLTSKTIDAQFNTISNLANGNISATAGIFGTKISPDFGAQNVVTTGYVTGGGGTLPASGGVRLGNTVAVVSRTSGGVDVNLVRIQATDEIVVGNASQDIILDGGTGKYVEARGDTFRVTNGTGGTTRAQIAGAGTDYVAFGAAPSATGDIRLDGHAGRDATIKYGRGVADYYVARFNDASSRLELGDTTQTSRVHGSQVDLYGAGNGIVIYTALGAIAGQVLNSDVQWAVPRHGNASAWGASEGRGSQAVTDGATTVVSSAVYIYAMVTLTGALTATRTVQFPAATDLQGYRKIINNTCTGAFSVTVTDGGAGTTVTVANGKTAEVWFDSRGVTRLTADI